MSEESKPAKRTDAARKLLVVARLYKGKNDAFADALTALANWHCEGRSYCLNYGFGTLSLEVCVVQLREHETMRSVTCSSLDLIDGTDREIPPWEVIQEAIRQWSMPPAEEPMAPDCDEAMPSAIITILENMLTPKPTEPPLANQILAAMEDLTEALEAGEPIPVTVVSRDGIRREETR